MNKKMNNKWCLIVNNNQEKEVKTLDLIHNINLLKQLKVNNRLLNHRRIKIYLTSMILILDLLCVWTISTMYQEMLDKLELSIVCS
jgi:hypothetical protein